MEKLRNYYFKITYLDGNVVCRSGVSKGHAKRVHDAHASEMVLLNVKCVSYGIMENG